MDNPNFQRKRGAQLYVKPESSKSIRVAVVAIARHERGWRAARLKGNER